MGLVNFDETVEMMASILGSQFNTEKLKKHTSLNEKLGVLRALAIGKLVDECTEIFLTEEQAILDGKFDKALTDVCPSKAALDSIGNISVEKIYRSRHVVQIEASGHEVLPGLLNEFVIAGFHLANKNESRKYANLALLLPEEVRYSIEQNPTDTYGVLRNVIDFVSGLTDRHALSLFRTIKGFSN
jgi:dGTPase